MAAAVSDVEVVAAASVAAVSVSVSAVLDSVSVLYSCLGVSENNSYVSKKVPLREHVRQEALFFVYSNGQIKGHKMVGDH